MSEPTQVVELEFLSPEEHKFWRANLTGSVLATVGGKHGAKGRSHTKDHGTVEKAGKALQKAIKKKHKEGFAPLDGVWPLPVPIEQGDGITDKLRVKVAPSNSKHAQVPPLVNVCPPWLEMHRPDLGYAFADGPKGSNLWFTGSGLRIGRGHDIRKVTPTLKGDAYKSFRFTMTGYPSRPDGEAMLVAHQSSLYELDIEIAEARLLHKYTKHAKMGAARGFTYTHGGRYVVWGRGSCLEALALGDTEAGPTPVLELPAESILDVIRLASGALAVLQESQLLVYRVEEGDDGLVFELKHTIACRKGFGLGTWHDRRVLALMTRSGSKQQTVFLAEHEGLHLLKTSKRSFRRAFDSRGAQWMIECAPGGEVDWKAYRVFNVEYLWGQAGKSDVLPVTYVHERPSLHDAIVTILDDRNKQGLPYFDTVLAKGGDLEEISNNRTLLAYAAWRGSKELTQRLLDAGANIDAVGLDGNAALSTAFARGFLEVARLLLDAGAKPVLAPEIDVAGTAVRVESPIVAAARNGYTDFVEELLAAGAPVNASGSDGLTLMGATAQGGHEALALDLLARGASADALEEGLPSPLLAADAGKCYDLLLKLVEASERDVKGQPGARVLRIVLLSIVVKAPLRPIARALVEAGAGCYGPDAFMYAIEGSVPEAVVAFLEGGYDPNTSRPTANKSNLPLHLAVAMPEPSTEIVGALLGAGADANGIDTRGITAIRYGIAQNSDLTIVTQLLEAGANVERTDANWGPLHEAACGGKLDAIELLVGRGADLEATTRWDETPLQLAAWNKRDEALTRLLDAEADVNGGAFTALMAAAAKNNVAAVDLLLERGAEIDREGISPYAKNDKTARTAQAYAEAANARETTARLSELAGGPRFTTLHAAAEADDLEVIVALLEGGADPNESEADRAFRPLHEARSVKAIDLLVKAGADPNAKDNFGLTPLLVAARGATDGALDLVSALLGHGANPKTRTKHNVSGLHQAASSGNVAVARRLIEAGCPLENKRKRVEQPLHLAAGRNHVEVAKLLLDSGARVGAWMHTIHGGQHTPLHEAADSNAVDAAALLIARGADVGASDGDSDNYDEGEFTPIHRAAESGHYDMLALLLSNDASGAVNLPIARGRYADEMAEDYPRCEALLQAVMEGTSVADYEANLMAEAGAALDADAAE